MFAPEYRDYDSLSFFSSPISDARALARRKATGALPTRLESCASEQYWEKWTQKCQLERLGRIK